MASEPRTSRFKDMTNATPEEWEADRAYIRRKLSEQETAAIIALLDKVDALNEQIRLRTGGRSIPDEEVEAAIQFAEDL